MARKRNRSVDDVRACAIALVLKLRAIHEDPQYRGVWMLSQAHGGQYTGPNYKDELAALESALALDA
jgi:hypothetical protein